MVYVLYAGFAGRSDRRAGIAAAVVAAETLIFAGNGFRCPLTQVAGRLGAERGSVTDIYLPRWFARNLPAIHVPLIGLAGFLHARNLRTRRRAGRHAAGHVYGPGGRRPPLSNWRCLPACTELLPPSAVKAIPYIFRIMSPGHVLGCRSDHLIGGGAAGAGHHCRAFHWCRDRAPADVLLRPSLERDPLYAASISACPCVSSVSGAFPALICPLPWRRADRRLAADAPRPGRARRVCA